MGTYRTSRLLIVEAVQSAETKTIATDLGFVNAQQRTGYNARRMESATSLPTYSSAVHLYQSAMRALQNPAPGMRNLLA
jgi:hypothetical protein